MVIFIIFLVIISIFLLGIFEEWIYYQINLKLFSYKPDWIKNKSLPFWKTKMNNQHNDNQ